MQQGIPRRSKTVFGPFHTIRREVDTVKEMISSTAPTLGTLYAPAPFPVNSRNGEVFVVGYKHGNSATVPESQDCWPVDLQVVFHAEDAIGLHLHEGQAYTFTQPINCHPGALLDQMLLRALVSFEEHSTAIADVKNVQTPTSVPIIFNGGELDGMLWGYIYQDHERQRYIITVTALILFDNQPPLTELAGLTFMPDLDWLNSSVVIPPSIREYIIHCDAESIPEAPVFVDT